MDTKFKAARTDYIIYSNRVTYDLHGGHHMHTAMTVDSEKRYNLIIWMRSLAVRNNLCPMCNKPPQLEEDITTMFLLSTKKR